MKYALLLLSCLMLATPAWSDHDPALREIEKLIRLRDYSEAVTRLATLAHKGNTEAQYRLAGLYRTGKGVNRDLVEAQELYRRAALAGSPDAQFSLALLIEKLDGSRSEARRWYRKSAAQGDRRAAQKLEQYEGTIEAKNEGITGEEIFNAIRHNDEDLIISLIEGGANLDLIDRNGNSTVIAALLAGWPQLAGILIDNTNLYARPNSRGSRPLHIASARGYRSVVLALLERDVDIDHTDARGDSALTLAVRNKNTEIARLLLDRGSRYDLVNDKKKTAVDLAYADDNPATKALFASYGIKPRAVASTKQATSLESFKETVARRGTRYAGWPLLNIAIELGETSVANQILAQKPDLGASDPDGNAALHVAARRADSTMLRRLIAQGVSVNATNLRNETALHLATESACLKCVQLLLRHRADPSIETKFEVTALELAVQKKQSKIALSLVQADSSYSGIHRVLLLAVQRKMERLSNALIKHDTGLASLDDQRRSVLWHSADNGLKKTTAYLLDTGRFNINDRDINGHSALAQAVKKGHVDVARLLIDNGADLTVPTNEGNSALMLAVLAKHPATVEFLLQREVDLNSRNKLGDTALMLAAGSGQNEVVEMLINAGADMQLRNKEDLNAFQIATNAGHQAAARIIHEKSNLVFKLFN